MANPHLLTGLGAALAMFLSAAGSSMASVPGGMFAQHASTGGSMGSMVWAFAPIIIGGVLAIYGMIIAVILSHNLLNDNMTETEGFRNLSAGLAVGLTCLASGLGMAHFVGAFMHHHHHGGPPPPPPGHAHPTNGTLVGSSETDSLLAAPLMKKPLIPTWHFLMVLVFIEAIGLYGLIVALLMSSHQAGVSS